MTGHRYAYADPPYPGQARKHYAGEARADGRVAREVNHPLLIAYLCDEFPDGWAMSTSSPSLRAILPLCPDDTRVGAWVKPFHIYKKGVRPAYAWEPLLFRGGRNTDPPTPPKGGAAITPKDFVSANITLRKGTPGAKPVDFCWWVFALLGVLPGDDFVDVFPGSGAVTDALDGYLGRLPTEPGTLFAPAEVDAG